MDKKLVLKALADRNFALTPDSLRNICLQRYARTSVYSYLLRLHQQKLVEQTFVGGRIAYRITVRGIERLEYLRRRDI
jgi:hypothetical protein